MGVNDHNLYENMAELLDCKGTWLLILTAGRGSWIWCKAGPGDFQMQRAPGKNRHGKAFKSLCEYYSFFFFFFFFFFYTYVVKHSVFAYPKREQYYNSRLCFEIARQFWLSTELCWQWDLARHFKTEPIKTVVFSFGISENIVFSNVIDSYHLVDERYIRLLFLFRLLFCFYWNFDCYVVLLYSTVLWHSNDKCLYKVLEDSELKFWAVDSPLACSQRQETLDLPYLTILCDNLKNRMFLQNFFSWHYFRNLFCFSSYPHHCIVYFK
jgi:hypothetical protein